MNYDINNWTDKIKLCILSDHIHTVYYAYSIISHNKPVDEIGDGQ